MLTRCLLLVEHAQCKIGITVMRCTRSHFPERIHIWNREIVALGPWGVAEPSCSINEALEVCSLVDFPRRLKNEGYAFCCINCFSSCLQNDNETTTAPNHFRFCWTGTLRAENNRKNLSKVRKTANFGHVEFCTKILPSFKANLYNRRPCSVV